MKNIVLQQQVSLNHYRFSRYAATGNSLVHKKTMQKHPEIHAEAIFLDADEVFPHAEEKPHVF